VDSFGRGLKSFLASGEFQYVAVVVICFWMSLILLLGADDCREYDDSNDVSLAGCHCSVVPSRRLGTMTL